MAENGVNSTSTNGVLDAKGMSHSVKKPVANTTSPQSIDVSSDTWKQGISIATQQKSEQIQNWREAGKAIRRLMTRKNSASDYSKIGLKESNASSFEVQSEKQSGLELKDAMNEMYNNYEAAQRNSEKLDISCGSDIDVTQQLPGHNPCVEDRLANGSVSTVLNSLGLTESLVMPPGKVEQVSNVDNFDCPLSSSNACCLDSTQPPWPDLKKRPPRLAESSKDRQQREARILPRLSGACSSTDSTSFTETSEDGMSKRAQAHHDNKTQRPHHCRKRVTKFGQKPKTDTIKFAESFKNSPLYANDPLLTADSLNATCHAPDSLNATSPNKENKSVLYSSSSCKDSPTEDYISSTDSMQASQGALRESSNSEFQPVQRAETRSSACVEAINGVKLRPKPARREVKSDCTEELMVETQNRKDLTSMCSNGEVTSSRENLAESCVLSDDNLCECLRDASREFPVHLSASLEGTASPRGIESVAGKIHFPLFKSKVLNVF